MYEGKLKELYDRYLEAHRLASNAQNIWGHLSTEDYLTKMSQANRNLQKTEASFNQERERQANLQNKYEIGHVSQLNSSIMQALPQIGAQASLSSSYPSPVMMEHLFSLMNANQPRYVPTKKGPAISDRVMNSFDPAFFSPEFIPPEEQ